MTTFTNNTAPTEIRILACQIDIPATTSTGDRDHHLQSAATRVINAAKQTDIQLIVLPELSSIDYSRASFEQLESLAEPLYGPSAECWRTVAMECNSHVAYSFPRITENGYTICVAVVDPAGKIIGHYDKMHLAHYGASMEKDYFERGEHLFTFDINGIRLSPIICYDIRFPELSRSLAIEHDVSVILHCGAYYRDASFYTWHDFVRTRALENQLYFLSLNRAGKNYGQSLFCPPWIDNTVSPTTFEPHQEDFKVVCIDMNQISQTRHEYSFLQDRLDNYQDISARGIHY